MVALRCPKCKAIVVAESGMLRCRHCRTPLHHCRRCGHFDPRFLACLHPEIIREERVRDPDEVRDCEHYYPRVTTIKRIKLLGLSRFTWMTLGLIGIIFFLLYTGLIKNLAAAGTEASLQLKLQSLGTIMSDETPSLVINIVNDGKIKARNVRLRLGQEAKQSIVIVSAEEPANQWQEEKTGYYLDCGDIEAGGALLTQLTFRPLHLGNYPLRVMVYADNARHLNAETRLNVSP